MPHEREAAGVLEAIYDEHVVPIYRFIHARVGNRPDAEDLTAQVFMRAVEQLDTSRDHNQVTAWLYRVSQNLIADYWRALYRLPVIGTEQVAPGWEPAAPPGRSAALAEATQDTAADRVRSLLRSLPERYAQVLELRFLQRLSVAETASRMGVSNGNAKVIQYRALRMAALLDESDD
ncbi:MAG: sigma-70 family RNA polymerase sigma factor [Chloroflexota bacterium]|nr:sigma-70 family RNA polymerase sigma factor [Chloroflexota bacterium]